MIPDYIKEMDKKSLKEEVRLYYKILTGTIYKGSVALHPGDDDYERIRQTYSWFSEELATR
jgi:hypothetical protein